MTTLVPTESRALGGLPAFELPAELEAGSPPEARGMTRDAVRMLVAHQGDGTLVHSHFSELPRFLDEGDLIVVNTSGTLAAAVPGTDSSGRQLEVHFSTQLPADLWTVELRRGDEAVVRGRARRRRRPRRRRTGRAPGAVRRASPGGPSVDRARPDPGAAAHLPGRARTSHPLRVRAGELADLDVPERVRHRARLGRDAERGPALHPRGPHPSRGARGGGGTDRAAHRGGVARGLRAPLSRVLPGDAGHRPPGQRHPARGRSGDRHRHDRRPGPRDGRGPEERGARRERVDRHRGDTRAPGIVGRRPAHRLARARGVPPRHAGGDRRAAICSSARTRRLFPRGICGTNSATST